jgi:hypothetical protein
MVLNFEVKTKISEQIADGGDLDPKIHEQI